MGDIMAQVGRHQWLMNMVGTAQDNRTGVETKEEKKNMKVGSYESAVFQHNMEDLCYAMWADNNIVRTLSNFHSLEILEAGLGLKRRRKVNKKREQHPTDVPCPWQQKDYSETFHLIDKGNGAEAKYDLMLENKKHGWTPKLALRFFNMTLNNAYKIYRWLLAKYNPGQPEHPDPVPSLARVHDTGVGRKRRSDAKGTVPGRVCQQDTQPASYLAPLRKKQKKHLWRTHQSFSWEKKGKCAYEGCPGIDAAKKKGLKRKRAFDTRMRCEECSAMKGSDVFFCNDFKNGKRVLCHLRWHEENCKSEKEKE